MNKNRKSLSRKLIIFAMVTAILVGKVLFAAFLLFTAKGALATPLAAKSTLVTSPATEELAHILNNLHTMQASFEQYSINKQNIMVGEKTIGNMRLVRPGKFRWEITAPNKQLIIINQNHHYVYDADLEQLVKRRIDYRNPLSPAMLLSSPVSALQKSFKITKLNSSNQNIWFKLLPKQEENSYQWIKMHFINGKLYTMHIADNFGQQSIINFNQLVLNVHLPSKIFTFTPPKNTDILEEK